MRILHLYDHTEPLRSGYVTRSQTLREATERFGHQCDIVSSVRQYSASEAEYHEGREAVNDHFIYRIKPHSVKIPILREICDIYTNAKFLVWMLLRHPYDVLHVHSPLLCGYSALMARWMAERSSMKIVYEIRAFWEDAAVDHGRLREQSKKYKIIQSLETKLCHRVDHVYTICQGLQRDLIVRGVPEDHITVIPNVVNVNNFEYKAAYPKALAEKIGIKEDEKILGFIGSFYEYEGLEELIPLMQEFRKYKQKYRILLVGGGAMDERIRAAITENGLGDYFILTGRVPHSEVQDYYTLCNAMIYPRRMMRLTETTTPLKPLEAMAMGKPVFLSDIGGHNELVIDKETGFFFPEGTPPIPTAHYIDATLKQTELLDKVTEKAVQYVRDVRNADYVAQKYYKF